jgi:putative flippase GtrA
MRFIERVGSRDTAAQFLRFIAVGLINSAVTYGIYLLFLRILPYAFAYSVSFGAGILISLFLNATWVFRKRVTARTTVQFPLVYVVQYLFGLALLAMFVERLGMRRELAPLLVVACTVPITFLLTRYVFRAS